VDQDTLVNADLVGGWRLIETLVERGFKIEVAFWAKLSGDEEKWVLYLASPMGEPTVDNVDLRESYRLVHDVLRESPEWGISPFSVIVLGVKHPMAQAAADIVKPKVAVGPFATPNPKPHRGMTRYGGRSLGGFPIDGASIYPPWESGINPVG
jgi:hypothetical protein